MRILVQRSKNSFVKVNQKVVGEIDFGFVLLVGFTHSDTEKDVDKMVEKVLKLRIFDDDNGVMNQSILNKKGKVLSISQFTLYADAKKGNRPSYVNALDYETANKLYDYFNEQLKKSIQVETGIFGSEMEVHIVNDGPVTILLEG